MRARMLLGFCLVMIGLGVLAPQAMAFPSAWYQFNDQYFTIPDDQWTQAPSGDWICTFRNATNDFQISGNIDIAGDPQIVYGVASQNFTNAPATFSFGFTNNFALIDGNNMVYGSYSGSVTDAGGDGIEIAPVASRMQVTDLNGTNATIDVGLGYSHGPGFPGQSYDAGAYQSGPKAGPVGNWTQMNTVLSYTLTGGADVATLNGSSVILSRPIPEPATALLLLPGLLGVAAYMRRKRA